MEGKRGLGHIEMILSFVLFAGFLIFGLYFFNPINNDRVLDSSSEYAYDEIIDNTTTTMIGYSVVVGENVPNGAIKIELDRGEADGNGIRIENYTENTKPFDEANGLVIDRAGDNFLRIDFGDFVSNKGAFKASTSTPLVLGSDFFVSSSDTKRIVTELRLEKLNASYYSDYLGLKQRFNLPNRIDFGFTVDMGDRKIKSMNEIPTGIEVFSKSERIEILRKNGKVEYADLVVSVW